MWWVGRGGRGREGRGRGVVTKLKAGSGNPARGQHLSDIVGTSVARWTLSKQARTRTKRPLKKDTAQLTSELLRYDHNRRKV